MMQRRNENRLYQQLLVKWYKTNYLPSKHEHGDDNPWSVPLSICVEWINHLSYNNTIGYDNITLNQLQTLVQNAKLNELFDDFVNQLITKLNVTINEDIKLFINYCIITLIDLQQYFNSNAQNQITNVNELLRRIHIKHIKEEENDIIDFYSMFYCNSEAVNMLMSKTLTIDKRGLINVDDIINAVINKFITRQNKIELIISLKIFDIKTILNVDDIFDVMLLICPDSHSLLCLIYSIEVIKNVQKNYHNFLYPFISQFVHDDRLEMKQVDNLNHLSDDELEFTYFKIKAPNTFIRLCTRLFNATVTESDREITLKIDEKLEHSAWMYTVVDNKFYIKPN